jgi:1,4-dihydroxy-2-naphthoate octaprenyltransferase
LTLLPTVAIAYIQAGTLPDPLWATLVPMFILGFNLLLLNEFPDIEPDQGNGRVNIPIVFGRQAAGYLYFALVGLLVVGLLYPIVTGLLPVTAALAILPVALLAPVFEEVILQSDPTVTEGALGNHVLWTQTTIVALGAGIGISVLL